MPGNRKPAGKTRKLPGKKLSAKDAATVKGGVGVVRKRLTLLRPSQGVNMMPELESLTATGTKEG